MDLARVCDGEVTMISLPYAWEYPDGRTVSGYCFKPFEELYAEGWREKIFSEPPQDANSMERWVYNKETDKAEQVWEAAESE